MSDLIRREDAIEQLNEAISICPPCTKGTGIYRTSALEEAIDIINSIPSADRPQGEWEYTNDPLRLDDEWECSRCGNISFARTNFCDRCGARMKGADDETD